MKIGDVQARAVVAPLDPPVRTAAGHVTEAPLLLVDLTTDEGVVGRSYLFGYHAFTLGPLRDLVRALGEMIKGDEIAPVELDCKLRARMTLFGTRGLQGMAVAGIDMAAWDALAVDAGVPLANLLGGRPRPIPAYNSLGTKRLGEQVRRNVQRFPADFMFRLTAAEARVLRSQFATSSSGPGWGGRRYIPYAFTEHGVAMLSSVLRTSRAIQVNIAIMRAFVTLRGLLASNETLARKLDELERRYDAQFKVVFDTIRQLMSPPAVGSPAIGFRPSARTDHASLRRLRRT